MKTDTLVVHAGRHPEDHHGVVNTPVYRFSTVLYPTVEELEASGKARFDQVTYGRYGGPTTFALEEAVAALDGGFRAIAMPSGLAAITGAISAFVGAGDHLLVTDSAYFPTRRFCDTVLTRFGVEITYYDPLVGGAIAGLMQDNTRAVLVESPGSLTFEIQDVPAIAEAAHARGAVVIMDNTWATPLFFKPFERGVDVSLQAATKYVVGHSDAMLGIVTTATEEHFRRIKTSVASHGFSAGSEEVFLGLRGLRTLPVRLRQHQETGILLANWLRARPEVARVMHPALRDDPGHGLWYRDFTGASGLFGVCLKPVGKAAVDAFLNSLKLFGMGYSWGGYESLIIPTAGTIVRTASAWAPPGPTLRLHAGLENADDLIEDLDRAFGVMNSSS